MASNFHVWVDQTKVNNVQDSTTFGNDSQRIAGFTAGTPASSIRVNTALRQANLVACAIMDTIDPEGRITVKSSVEEVAALLQNLLVINSAQAIYAQYIGTVASHGSIGTTDRPVYVNAGQITAGNYIPKLNNSSQSSSATAFYAPTQHGSNGQVLKSSGSGAPTWTNQSSLSVGSATNATYATYASLDTSKGTIEQRLTSLGFRDADIVDSDNTIVGHVYRQGNYVYGYLNTWTGKAVVIPANFRPRVDHDYIGVEGDITLTLTCTGLMSVPYTTQQTYGQQYISIKTTGIVNLNKHDPSIDYNASNNTLTAKATFSFDFCEFGYICDPIT